MPRKKKLSAAQQTLVDHIYSKIGKLSSYKKIRRILIDNGYLYITQGGFKSVFKRPGSKYCIKVYTDSYGWYEDSYYIPKGKIRKHVLVPIYRNKRYMIQRWAKKKRGTKTIKELPEEVYKYFCDIHDDNIRVDGDREVIIDFCH